MLKYTILAAAILAAQLHAAAIDVVCAVGAPGPRDTVVSARVGDTLDVWAASARSSAWHVTLDSGKTWDMFAFVSGVTNHQRYVVAASLAGKAVSFKVMGQPYADAYSGRVLVAAKTTPVISINRPQRPGAAAARYRDAAGRQVGPRNRHLLAFPKSH